MAKITVTWKKSTIGFPQDQRRTIAGLGLRRLNHTVEHEATPSILGMVNKVQHLVEIAEAEVAAPVRKARRSTARSKASKKDETA